MKPHGKNRGRSQANAPQNPAGASAGLTPGSAIASTSRLWLFRLLAVTAVPLLLLGGLEVGLRVASYGYSTQFFRKLTIQGQEFLVQNDDFARRFFPPELVRRPEAFRMRAAKPSGTVRIFVLGESAAMGDPAPLFGPARHLEALLSARFPKTEFEVVTVAFTAINSHVILPIAQECARQEGDIWIIYMGNNEMVGPFGAATVFGQKVPPLAFVRLVLAVQQTRIGQLGMQVSRKLKGAASGRTAWAGMEMFNENRVGPNSEPRELVYQAYRKNLRDILDRGLNSGARIVLNTVAVNLKDSPPFASQTAVPLGVAEEREFERLQAEARRLEQSGDARKALELIVQAAQMAPHHAGLQYLWGQCLHQTGDVNAARQHFQLACDFDALPFRADSRINEAIREAARGRPVSRLRLIDTAELLATEGAATVAGEESFYEHVHFTFEGAHRLGLIWAREVEQMLPESVRSSATGGWISSDACDERLGLTPWNRALVLHEVIQRMQKSPLKNQPNNEARTNRLLQVLKGVIRQAGPQAIPAAEALYQTQLRKHPEDFCLPQAYAYFFQTQSQWQRSVEQWRATLRLLPHAFRPLHRMGVLLTQQGDRPQGRRYLKEALALRPYEPELWHLLAVSYADDQQFDPAVAAIAQARKLSPGDLEILMDQGRMLVRAGRYLEGVRAFREAVTLAPTDWKAHDKLADALAHAGEIESAIEEWQAVIHLNPSNMLAHLNQAAMHAKLGRLDQAIQKAREAVALDPNDETARAFLQQSLQRKARLN